MLRKEDSSRYRPPGASRRPADGADRSMEEKTWWVYILRCADGSLYCGVTNDRARRLRQHNDGTGARYTRSRRPVEMIWSEEAEDRPAALRREAAIKALSRAEKIKLINS